jgi:hypothetical protein
MQTITYRPRCTDTLFSLNPAGLVLKSMVCLVLLAVSVAPLSAQTVSGMGTRTCGALVEAAERESKEAIDGYLSWAQGFISGYNWANPGRQQVRLDHGGLLHWLLQYCTSNKGDKYYQAVQAAITVHAR